MHRYKSLLLTALFPPSLWAQEAPKPYGALPSERQLRWHEMETYCLIHYTPTTFQDKEWGYGDADPSLFNPTAFNSNQIAAAAAMGGFKGLISVAKHHDGFCLWPTATTDYSVKRSPWKNGKGDMVQEFKEAAHANGLQFGVYLSAWDRNDTRYGSPAYADAYREQLTELMTQYGPLFTSWHDGANGGDGYYGGKREKRTIDRTTYYAWEEKTWPIIRRHQPMAMIFSDIGPDMRWVGNEHGFADETSWATFTPEGVDGKPAVPGQSNYKDSPSGTRHGKYWIPAECDVPLRKGWFYHANEDNKVKTPDQLFEIYLKSVGRGGAMDLGLAPMPEGYLHPNDVKSLTAFGHKLKETFRHNLAAGAQIQASNIRHNSPAFATRRMLDDDRYSYYASDDEVLNPQLEVTLAGEKEFDLIRLRENIKLGQRLDSVLIDTWQGDRWQLLTKATSIGANRLIKLDQPVKASKLRIRLFAPVAPTLSDFGLYREFSAPFAFDTPLAEQQELGANEFTVKTQGGLPKAFDAEKGSIETMSSFAKGIVFELRQPASALIYLPRQDGSKEGMALKYEVSSSDDGKTWKILRTGEFSNIQANPVAQHISFGEPVTYKYLRFTPKETVGNTFTVATFRLLK